MLQKLKNRFNDVKMSVNDKFIESVSGATEDKFGNALVVGTVGVATAVSVASPLMAADDIFDKAESAGKDMVDKLTSLSTVFAVLFFIVANVMRIFTRSQRAIDELNTWMKRIMGAWLVIRLINYFLRFGRDLAGDEEIEWT